MTTRTLLFAGLFALAFGFFGNSQIAVAQSEPSVEFHDLWVDYDVYRKGEKGMIVHTQFTVHNLLNRDLYLTIRILGTDGEPLTSPNTAYRNTKGQMAVFSDLKPAYEAAYYSDVEVFVPYSEIRLTGGPHALQIDADLIYENGDLIQHLNLHDFDYTGGSTTPGPSTGITAQFEDMWIDYDVYEKGEKGMRMHVKFKVQNMKNIPGYVGFGFETEEGELLYTSNQAYRSENGQLAVYYDITPAYDDTQYSDVQIFLPYDELIAPEGDSNLRVHVDLLYGEEGNVHLTYYSFIFTRSFN